MNTISFVTSSSTTPHVPAKITNVESLDNNKLKLTLVFETELVVHAGLFGVLSFKDTKGKETRVLITITKEQENKNCIIEIIDFDPNLYGDLISRIKVGDFVEFYGPSEKPFNVRKTSEVISWLVACFSIFLLSASIGVYIVTHPKKTDFTNAVDLSISGMGGDAQKPIQDYLVEQIKDGNNDDKTKQAMFLIAHRFFDNGGDIYEIYDFVNSSKEVAFLKEAEKIEPEAFELIKAKKVTRYDTPSTLALLSYFEVADQHGYANMSMLGTAANKYAELAYNYRRYSSTFGAATTTMDKGEAMAVRFISKSLKFSLSADNLIKKSTNGTFDLKQIENSGLLDEDILIGLNQFASAQFFYSGMGERTISTVLPGDIYSFNSDFARRKVPRLYMFTNYLWATSNIYSGTLSPLSISAPLNRVIEYGKANKDNPRPAGSMLRIINSKTNNEKSVFSYENAKILAKNYKPFRDWLVETGWKESDFK